MTIRVQQTKTGYIATVSYDGSTTVYRAFSDNRLEAIKMAIIASESDC